MKNIDFEKASFKDFENIQGMDPYGWAKLWGDYVIDRSKNGQFNYRQENLSGCGPEIELNLPSNPHRNFVSLVSNDYLGFTQHPKVKAAAIAAIEKYGSGAGASPAIGATICLMKSSSGRSHFFKRSWSPDWFRFFL